MTRLTLYLDRSLEENAGAYYEKAKKLKKKIEGARKAWEETRKKIALLEKEAEKEKKREEQKKPEREKKWFEKFRWFISSEGFLVVGGRDATSNEIIVKKHAEKNDLVFHTDITGSPFFVVKAENKKIGDKTKQEAADATVTYSKAWKMNLQTTSVFFAMPEQLTKTAKPGEYVPRGGFVTTGKLNYIGNRVNLAVGITKEEEIMAGPVDAIRSNCEKFVEIGQGREKTSQTAKKIQKKIGGELDEIVRALPAGGCEIKK